METKNKIKYLKKLIFLEAVKEELGLKELTGQALHSCFETQVKKDEVGKVILNRKWFKLANDETFPNSKTLAQIFKAAPNSKIVVNAKYWELLEGKVNTHEQLVTKLSIIASSLDLKIHDSGIFFNDKSKSKLMNLAPEEALDALLSVTLFNIAALNSDKNNINGITDYFCQVASELTYDLLKAMATTAPYQKYSSELFNVIGKLFHSSLLHQINSLSCWAKHREEFLFEVEQLRLEGENLQADFLPMDNISIVSLLLFSLQFDKNKEYLELNHNKSEQKFKSQYIVKRSNMFRPSYKKIKVV